MPSGKESRAKFEKYHNNFVTHGRSGLNQVNFYDNCAFKLQLEFIRTLLLYQWVLDWFCTRASNLTTYSACVHYVAAKITPDFMRTFVSDLDWRWNGEKPNKANWTAVYFRVARRGRFRCFEAYFWWNMCGTLTDSSPGIQAQLQPL